MRALLSVIVLSLICSSASSQEEDKPKLPHDAQSALDAFNKTHAKLEEDFKHKVGAEREKLYAQLDKASKEAAKKGDADGIVAIKAEMKKIIADSNKDDDTDMLGPKITPDKVIIGKWNLGDTGIVWVFTDDNKCASMPSNTPGSWKVKSDTEIEVVWVTHENDIITTTTMKARTPGGTLSLTPAK